MFRDKCPGGAKTNSRYHVRLKFGGLIIWTFIHFFDTKHVAGEIYIRTNIFSTYVELVIRVLAGQNMCNLVLVHLPEKVFSLWDVVKNLGHVFFLWGGGEGRGSENKKT